MSGDSSFTLIRFRLEQKALTRDKEISEADALHKAFKEERDEELAAVWRKVAQLRDQIDEQEDTHPNDTKETPEEWENGGEWEEPNIGMVRKDAVLQHGRFPDAGLMDARSGVLLDSAVASSMQLGGRRHQDPYVEIAPVRHTIGHEISPSVYHPLSQP